MTLVYGNRTINVEINAENARFTPGFGVYPLTLYVTLTPNNFTDDTIAEINGELELYSASASRWLASNTHPLRINCRTGRYSVEMTFPLTSAQILGIEEHRAGQDPGFNLKVFGYLLNQAGGELDKDTSQYFRIASSTWLRLVEQINAAVAFTIPIPIAITEGAHAEGAELIKEARQQLNAGNIDNAIVAARKIMERAESAANWPDITKNDDLRQRSQDQRWRAILKAALDQAAGAAHNDDTTKDFTYTRREAEAIIGIATALLKAAPGPLH